MGGTHSLLIFFLSVDIAFGIRCYSCGTESVASLTSEDSSDETDQKTTLLKLESCQNLEFSFASWGSSAVDCGPGQVCVKTILDEFDEFGSHHYVTGSRGCAMRNTSQGQRHWMGCGVLKTNAVPPAEMFQTKWDIVCFCNDDYCNGAMKDSFKVFMLISLLLIGNLF